MNEIEESEEFVKQELLKEEPVVEKPKKLSVAQEIAAATEAAKRLEAANLQMENLILKQQQLRVESTLGGEASAGKPSVSDEEKKQQAARDFLAETGFSID